MGLKSLKHLPQLPVENNPVGIGLRAVQHKGINIYCNKRNLFLQIIHRRRETVRDINQHRNKIKKKQE